MKLHRYLGVILSACALISTSSAAGAERTAPSILNIPIEDRPVRMRNASIVAVQRWLSGSRMKLQVCLAAPAGADRHVVEELICQGTLREVLDAVTTAFPEYSYQVHGTVVLIRLRKGRGEILNRRLSLNLKYVTAAYVRAAVLQESYAREPALLGDFPLKVPWRRVDVRVDNATIEEI